MSEHEHDQKLKGKFIYSIGKRKTSVALVRLYKNGSGLLLINNKKINDYFPEDDLRNIIYQPLKLTGHLKDINISINLRGGGKISQSQAARHGLARVLEIMEKDLRPALKAKGWLTRDSRKKERKKPGLKKARRAPQWGKR